MNNNFNYEEIANTDFRSLCSEQRQEAEDRMVMLICDPELTAKRILRLIRQRLLSVDDSEPEDGTGRNFEQVIEVLRQHGPLPALHANLITFEQLIELADNPQALRLAHKAIVEWEDPELSEPTPPVVRRIPGEQVSRGLPAGYALSASSDDDDDDDDDTEYGAWYEDSEVGEDAEELVMLGGESEVEAEDEFSESGRQALPSLEPALDWSNVTKEQFVSRCQDRELLMVEASLIPQLSGASEEQTLPPASQEVIKIENGRIRIFAPHEMIPDGLCRLMIVAFDRGGQVKATRLVLPPLDYRQGYWMWGTALLDLFGHDLTEMSVLTALETTVQTDFHTTEVQEFVSKLPDSEQRWLGQKYLDSNGGSSQ